MKTQDALSLLIALEERVARIYFQFFQAFREDPIVARCWWDLARDEYGHAGVLKMVREVARPEMESREIGPRLWLLVETLEHCEEQARQVETLGRALELAIRLESSELDALGHRVVQSVQTDLPEGTARSFAVMGAHYRRLAEAAACLQDQRLRQRLESMLTSRTSDSGS
ncbi:MAG TPA: hypothetical protein VMD08_13000 [Candidatus Baltobacteraceae bacterium]|nr:hypothetical protein [Candidatus Baltobacteraceae bacterium]